MAVFDHPEWFSRSFGGLYRALIPELARRAQTLIAVSAHAKQRILETLKVKETKVHVIANGVGPAFCARSASEISTVRSRLQIPEGPYVLSVCSLEPRKNLSNVLAAWNIVTKNTAGVNLVLTGAGNATVFRSVAQPLQKSKNVFLTGYVEDEHLPALYSGASCFLYVSLYEGFGLPVLEALACDTPVITSNSTSLREIGYPVCRLVDPCSSHEIASAIAEALGGQSSPESRALGRKHASRYTWERCAADTERLVLSLN
jgi:glycosyltransferase involved in cell wall biosynthesis